MRIYNFFLGADAPLVEERYTDPASRETETRLVPPSSWEAKTPDGKILKAWFNDVDAGRDIGGFEFLLDGVEISGKELQDMYNIPK